jgi:hypothetical protein
MDSVTRDPKFGKAFFEPLSGLALEVDTGSILNSPGRFADDC